MSQITRVFEFLDKKSSLQKIQTRNLTLTVFILVPLAWFMSNSTKEKIVSTFDSSRNYCKNISKEASLLFIDNAIEALEGLKWIGK